MRPDGTATRLPWKGELWWRIRHLFAIKFVGTTVVTWVFFVGYFHLLRHPVHAITMVPLTALDHWIPFVPAAIVPYLSLWFYVGIAPGLQRTFTQLAMYGVWAVALCATGLAIFWQWPTAIAPLPFVTSGYFGFDVLQGLDTRANACPSMHVAIALFSALWIDLHLRESRVPAAIRLVNWAWLAAITLSTLAVRQHVVVDVVAGAVLGAAFAIPSILLRPRTNAGGADRTGYHGARASTRAKGSGSRA